MIDRNKHFPVRHFGGHWSIGHWPRLEAVVRWIRSLILLNSPASIMRAWLVSEGYGSYPSSGEEWPIFVSHLPDDDSLHNAICVYDTSRFQHGELPDGESIEHKGIHISVRGRDFEQAREKWTELSNALEVLKDETLTLGVNVYYIDNVVRMYLHHDGYEARRRSMFSSYYSLLLFRMVQA